MPDHGFELPLTRDTSDRLGASDPQGRWLRLEEFFHRALELPRDQRSEFLARECATDLELRGEIEALLAAEQDTRFLGAVDSPRAVEGLLNTLPARGQEVAGRRLGPWQLVRVLGEGGMGLVYLAERSDGVFDKQVAVKLLRAGLAAPDWLARFDAERRVLARLEHPGIARLLDAGADEHGAPYLVMEYVEGERIDRWCDARRASVRERVRLLASVARAVEHAHRALIVHRDLKPANILVDTNGAPRLLDFGIAKALSGDAANSTVALDLTRTGERPLTPAYASPEQLAEAPIGLASDVWSLGIVLHELLTGLHPHRKETRTRPELETAVRTEIAEAPSRFARRAPADQPTPEERAAARATTPHGLDRALRGDLDRIVGMALRKEPERRYGSAAEFADDLERWLDGLPVRASGDGLGYRVGRLARRHPLEFGLGAALLAAAITAGAWYVRQRERESEQLARIQRLSDLQRYEELVVSATRPVAMVPERAAEFDAWVSEAEALARRAPEHRATLELMRAEDLSGAAEDQRRWHAIHVERLEQLIAGLEALGRPDPHDATIAAQRRRATIAHGLARTSLEEPAGAWAEARAALRVSPRYTPEFDLPPQLGLVPLGPDPTSGLWEFWHVSSGARPTRGADGRIALRADDGLVFVLVPGGTARVGAQRDDPELPNYDATAEPDELPVRELELAPFFVSKYEVTQSQWLAWAGSNPSKNPAGTSFRGETYTLLNPVELVPWTLAMAELERLALTLPTEAQWEYACRAGTSTAWTTGPDERSVAGHANFADAHAHTHGGPRGWNYSDWADDGYVNHAPVGSYPPNAFGLHDILGNVWEWTRDSVDPKAPSPRAGDGLLSDAPTAEVLSRGGSYANTPFSLRSAERYAMKRENGSLFQGFRPARPLNRSRPESR
jgi:formylglycine-generating enzyme required for sulfatase activity